MRRPHPRFDERRNAWVTNTGGRLKFLAKGPKNTETEQQAWGAFSTEITAGAGSTGSSSLLGNKLRRCGLNEPGARQSGQ